MEKRARDFVEKVIQDRVIQRVGESFIEPHQAQNDDEIQANTITQKPNVNRRLIIQKIILDVADLSLI